MSEREYVLVLQLFISVAVAWFVYAYIYKRTRQDGFRENLFAIRDDLFDYMWKNNVPYDLPAYGALRSALNGVIRAVDSGEYNIVMFGIYAEALHRGVEPPE